MSNTVRFTLGSARVPRVVFGVPPKTPVPELSIAAVLAVAHDDGSGGTPEPTRETRVLPEH